MVLPRLADAIARGVVAVVGAERREPGEACAARRDEAEVARVHRLAARRVVAGHEERERVPGRERRAQEHRGLGALEVGEMIGRRDFPKLNPANASTTTTTEQATTTVATEGVPGSIP